MMIQSLASLQAHDDFAVMEVDVTPDYKIRFLCSSCSSSLPINPSTSSSNTSRRTNAAAIPSRSSSHGRAPSSRGVKTAYVEKMTKSQVCRRFSGGGKRGGMEGGSKAGMIWV